jgi:regulator of sirC expression with transglutaminase-like and TPR domain
MKPPESQNLPPQPRQQALLTLLGDEDPVISDQIRDQLLKEEGTTRHWLEPHRLHPDPVIRRRVQSLLKQMKAREADAAFLAYIRIHGEYFDLENAVWMFVQTEYPEISVQGYLALLDLWAGEILESWKQEGGRHTLNGQELLDSINRQLFGHLGFRGNEENYFDFENSYANRVIDRRLGNPIGLCFLYLCLCQRLELPVQGVGMPGHFVCRYQTSLEEYYIDVFHGGRRLSRQDCIRRLKSVGMDYDEGSLHPISSRRILQRMVANLHLIYKEQKDREQVERLQRYLVALAR